MSKTMSVYFGFTACCLFLLLFGLKEQNEAYAQSNAMDGELNSPCNTVKDCRNFGYICKENICQCEQRYVFEKLKMTCLGGVDQKCLYDEHCINGAYCMNQSICKCKHSSSQVLEHGLVCAGSADIRKHNLLNYFFILLNVVINTFIFRYFCVN